MISHITVKQLSISAVTGEPSRDPYGQGFASISAEIEIDNDKLSEQLELARQKSKIVTVRCAMLEVTGQIMKAESNTRTSKFILAVDNIVYHKPKEPWER